MLAESGSIYPLDIWNNVDRTIVRTSAVDIPIMAPLEMVWEITDRNLQGLIDEGGRLESKDLALGVPPEVVIIEENPVDEEIRQDAGISFEATPQPGREPLSSRAFTLAG